MTRQLIIIFLKLKLNIIQEFVSLAILRTFFIEPI